MTTTCLRTNRSVEVLNPKFSRSMAKTIKTLKSGYDQDQWLNAFTEFLISLDDNPHRVIKSLARLVSDVYLTYVETARSPVCEEDFHNLLVTSYVVATERKRVNPIQMQIIMVTQLMRILYGSRVTSATY